MYNLEKHLHTQVAENSQYEVLLSAWNLNKKYIPNAQSAISFNFPHYSLHERSHSDTIIKNIESFLGEDRIKSLSPTDTWLILMSAYTHDLGMIVFNNVLESEWVKSEFQDYLKNASLSSYDKDLNKAANLLLDLSKENSSVVREITFPLDVRRAVIIVTADYFRKNHHYRSKQIISGIDTEFYKLISNLNLDNIPNRFSSILAEIAYGHGIDFYKVLERLEQEADGYSSDKMHPRFIAYLLRLGDLLDVDDKRFNIFHEKTFGDSLPVISKSHKEKHASVKHLLISPTSIEVTVDCNSDEVYRVARGWFDWLQKEVEDQSKEWTNISPLNFLGGPPIISRGKIKVLYQSIDTKEELMNLRFQISNKKIFEILEGSALYENVGYVFLREIVQNAIDASKIQFWKFIKSGVYDYIIKTHLNVSDIAHKDLLQHIKFPSDLPEQIWENFQIYLNIDWKDDTKQVLKIEILDNGTGISESDLIRLTSKVGESRSEDTDYRKSKETTPYWLKPTGAFGIGLQSIFLVTDSFVVISKSESEEPREIIFYSAKNDEYSRLSGNKPVVDRGTKVTIEIKKDLFPDIFPDSFSGSIVSRFDIFSDKYKDVYLYKLREFILDTFINVETLNVSFMGDDIIKSKFVEKFKYFNKSIDSVSRSSILNVFGLVSTLNDDKTRYHIEENAGIGSEITLEFVNSFDLINVFSDYDLTNNDFIKSGYLIKNIPISEEFPKFRIFRYCNLIWNFQSQDSDKILNISREKLIFKTREKYFDLLFNSIFPEILLLIFEVFEKINKPTSKHLAEYFHIIMEARMFKVDYSQFLNFRGSELLPDHIATDTDCIEISINQFFSAKTILSIRKNYETGKEPFEVKTQSAYNNIVDKTNCVADIIIWDMNYFSEYVKESGYYIIKKLQIVDDEGTTSVNILSNSFTNIFVECDMPSKQSYLKNVARSGMYSEGLRRDIFAPVKEYAEHLAVKESFDTFGVRLEYYNQYIISPFNGDLFNRIKLSLHQEGILNDIPKGTEYVRQNYLDKIAPDNLVSFILENSTSKKKSAITKQDVLNAYLKLVMDVIEVNSSL